LESSTQWLAPVWLKPSTEFGGGVPGEVETTASADVPEGVEVYLSIDWWLFENRDRDTMDLRAVSIAKMHDDVIDTVYRVIPLDRYREHSIAIVLATWPKSV
jgi:hypothetical protein